MQLHSVGTPVQMGRIGTLQSLQSLDRGARSVPSGSSGRRRSTRNMSRKLQRQLAWAHQDYSTGREADHMHLRRALDICPEDFATRELAEVKEETHSTQTENMSPGLHPGTSSHQVVTPPHQAPHHATSSGSSPRSPGGAASPSAADLRGVAILELEQSSSTDFDIVDYAKSFGPHGTVSSWRHGSRGATITRNGTQRSTLRSGGVPEAAEFQKLHGHDVLHQELHGSLNEVSSSMQLMNMHVQHQTGLQERQASAMEALLRHVRRAEQLPQSQGPQLEAPATQRPFGWLGGLPQAPGAKAAQPPPPPRLQTIVDEDQHPGQEQASNSMGLSFDLPPQQPHQAASRGRQERQGSRSPPSSQPPELHRSVTSSQS